MRECSNKLERRGTIWRTGLVMGLNWRLWAKPRGLSKARAFRRSSTAFGRTYLLRIVPRVIDEIGNSGKCVYQAESNHSILSDASFVPNLHVHFILKFCTRHTNALRYTSTTHTKRLYWIIIGASAMSYHSSQLTQLSLKVPAIRSVLEYFKCLLLFPQL